MVVKCDSTDCKFNDGEFCQCSSIEVDDGQICVTYEEEDEEA